MKRLLIPFFLITMLALASCGGPGICECHKEADKENPDEDLMEKCRVMLAEMEIDEVLKAVEDCD